MASRVCSASPAVMHVGGKPANKPREFERDREAGKRYGSAGGGGEGKDDWQGVPRRNTSYDDVLRVKADIIDQVLVTSDDVDEVGGKRICRLAEQSRCSTANARLTSPLALSRMGAVTGVLSNLVDPERWPPPCST